MNESEFFNMNLTKRVLMVNKLLKEEKEDQLKITADKIGITYSQFTKEMQKGNYVYIKRLNKYCKFMDEETENKSNLKESSGTLTIEFEAFLQENFEVLQKIVEIHERKQLILCEAIFDGGASNKSFKINDNVYQKFINLCKEKFPMYRQMDLMGQALYDFHLKHIG
ncbi:hypothetical protein [Gottfriedia luciferensis]|uniref:hypothetical protein n=1 Tax=Gottfriedia luciferensis TaxID=178774 RepID=UPI000B43DA79|nr:hypothetical protein [Gottfriedia luciferensis]